VVRLGLIRVRARVKIQAGTIYRKRYAVCRPADKVRVTVRVRVRVRVRIRSWG
jgi:hypothetical protein